MQANRIVSILVERDGMSSDEARRYVKELREAIAMGDCTLDEALEELGLEPDYVEDLL